MNEEMWESFGSAVSSLGSDSTVRAVVLAGDGPAFCAGIDLSLLAAISATPGGDKARRAINLRRTVTKYQRAFSLLEEIPQPVIASIHGLCIGGGVDLVSAADIRYASKDAVFNIKEVEVGLAADVGTLQRFPKVCGNASWVRELVFTSRDFGAAEALNHGFISRVLENPAETRKAAIDLAKTIAEKSPLAVAGSKRSLIFSRDRSVAEGLADIAAWNSAALDTEDMSIALAALKTGTKPTFKDL